MQTELNIAIREASQNEDLLIAQHFYQMWRDNDVADESIRFDWLETTLQFINNARQDLFYQAFIAIRFS